MKLLMTAFLFLSATSFAKGLPVLSGTLSQVESVSLIPNPMINGAEVHAQVKYYGGCNGVSSFSVIKGQNFSFTVVENRIPPAPHTAQCQAISIMSQDLVVGIINGPSPESVTVNGVAAK